MVENFVLLVIHSAAGMLCEMVWNDMMRDTEKITRHCDWSTALLCFVLRVLYVGWNLPNDRGALWHCWSDHVVHFLEHHLHVCHHSGADPLCLQELLSSEGTGQGKRDPDIRCELVFQ